MNGGEGFRGTMLVAFLTRKTKKHGVDAACHVEDQFYSPAFPSQSKVTLHRFHYIHFNSFMYLRHNYFNEVVKDLFSDHNDGQLHQELE